MSCVRARAVALAARLALALLALELRHLVLALLRHAVLKVIKRLHHRLAVDVREELCDRRPVGARDAVVVLVAPAVHDVLGAAGRDGVAALDRAGLGEVNVPASASRWVVRAVAVLGSTAALLRPQISVTSRTVYRAGMYVSSLPVASTAPSGLSALRLRLRPGFFLGSLISKWRKQPAFLHTHVAPDLISLGSQPSGSQCHWPEDSCGFGHCLWAHGPWRGMIWRDAHGAQTRSTGAVRVPACSGKASGHVASRMGHQST